MMRYEHYGKREATSYYKSNINGRVQEVHLCQQCAEELGYASGVMSGRNLFDLDFFGGDLMRSFFRPMLGGFGTNLLTEFPSPEEEARPAREEEPAREESGDLLSGSEQDSLRRQRRRNALETQLKQAVEEENYEQAAKLRDELRQLPQA